MNLQTICYVSTARYNLKVESLEALFKETKINNAKNSVTGILIYKSGNFLQIIEGESLIISNLFKAIYEDDRHKYVIKLIDSKIQDRVFDDYNTGFSIIMNNKESRDLDSYINWLENSGLESVKKLTKIIQDFLKD